MTKSKQKTKEITFSSFVHASVFDRPLARHILQGNSSWLTAANSLGETALAYVIIENYLDAVRFLLAAGADINTRDLNAETPLIQAAGLGYQEMVALLLECGADVNAANGDQETSLFKAVRSGHIEICEMLLKAGAEVQVQNFMGENLSNIALPRKYEQVMNILARYGYREPVQTPV